MVCPTNQPDLGQTIGEYPYRSPKNYGINNLPCQVPVREPIGSTGSLLEKYDL